MRRALVVEGGGVRVESILGAMAAAGFEALPVASLGVARPLVEGGAVAVVVGRGVEEEFSALASWPPAVRRGCVVVALGGSDEGGMAAFRLGVDLVVPESDETRLGEVVAAAVAAKRLLVTPLDPVAAARLGV